MPDVAEQIRIYADAVERSLDALDVDAVADRATRRPRRRWVLTAAAAAVLMVVAGSVVLLGGGGEDDDGVPTITAGPVSPAPDRLRGAWFVEVVQADEGRTFVHGYEADAERPALVVEDERVTLRYDCFSATAPASYTSGDVDGFPGGAIALAGSWVVDGCDPPAELDGFLDATKSRWSINPAYEDLVVQTTDGLQLRLVEQIHESADAQLLLEGLRGIVTNFDGARPPGALVDQLPNDLYTSDNRVRPINDLVVIGELRDYDVETERQVLHLRFDVSEAYGEEAPGDEVTVGLLARGDDPDRLAAGFEALGRVVLFLDRDNPVYGPDLVAIVADGGYLATIDDAGDLALPPFPRDQAAELLTGGETLEKLRAALREPPKIHP